MNKSLIACLAFALIETGRLGWFSPLVWLSFIFALVGLILFIVAELMSSNPMVPLSIFRDKNYSVGIIVGMILNIAFYGELFLLPIYFESVLHYSVAQTGLALIPLVAIVVVASFYSGQLSSKIGVKVPMIIGLLFGVVGFLILNIVVHINHSYYVFVLPFLLIGFGIAFTMPASTLCVMQSVDPSKKGVAAGAYNTGRQIGSMVGVALFGSFIANQATLLYGFSITLWIAAALYLLGFILVILLIKHRPSE